MLPARDHQSFQPTRELPGISSSTSFTARDRAQGFTLPREPAIFCLAEFFPAGRSRAQVDRETRLAADAPARARRGRTLDARTHRRRERRTRGGVPGDVNSIIALRASVILPATGSIRRPAILPGLRRTIRRFRLQPCLSRCGTPRSTSSRWRSLACRRTTRFSESGRLAGWEEVRLQEIGRSIIPSRSRARLAFDTTRLLPDTDDTAMVLMALLLVRPSEPEALANCSGRRASPLAIEFSCGDGGLGRVRPEVTQHCSRTSLCRS